MHYYEDWITLYSLFFCMALVNLLFLLSRQEQEDLELKHNSTLKQLMREFHTQLAQKEQELETTLKETIGKEKFKFNKEQISISRDYL